MSYQIAVRSHERAYIWDQTQHLSGWISFSPNSTLSTRNESKTKQHDSSRMELVQKGDEILCSHAVNRVPRESCATPLHPKVSLQLNTHTPVQTLLHPGGVHYSNACVSVVVLQCVFELGRQLSAGTLTWVRGRFSILKILLVKIWMMNLIRDDALVWRKEVSSVLNL